MTPEIKRVKPIKVKCPKCKLSLYVRPTEKKSPHCESSSRRERIVDSGPDLVEIREVID